VVPDPGALVGTGPGLGPAVMAQDERLAWGVGHRFLDFGGWSERML
jgi:hypothetical protein